MNHLQGIFERDVETVPTTSVGVQALAISISFTSIAAATVLVRLYTRLRLIRNPGFDDYMIVASLICSIVFMAFFIGEVKWGLGTHITQLTAEQGIKLNQNFYVTLPTYYCTIFLTKLSMLFQYFRIVPNDFHRITFWITLGVLIAYSLWTIASSIFICFPIAHFWDSSVPGSCLDKKALWFSNAAMNILLDVWVLLLPIPAIYKLQLPTRQKLAIMLVFVVGGIVCLTSILRLTTLAKIANSNDPSYDNVGAATWSAIEANTGIVCACLPALKPLLVRLFPRFISTAGRTSRPSYYGGPTTLRNTARGYQQSAGDGFHMCTIDVEAEPKRKGTFDDVSGIQVTTEVKQAHIKTAKYSSDASESTLDLTSSRD